MISAEYLSKFNVSDQSQVLKMCVLFPIIESSRYIRDLENVNTLNENNITEKIYTYVKYKSSISKVIQKHLITIHCRPIEIIEGTRTEPDLELTVFNCFTIGFEAKRIYSKGYTEYCGQDGLECFLNGYYSSEDNIGGMLAYIQKGDVLKVKNEIIKRVKNKQCIDMTNPFIVELSFLSVHKRVNLDNTINIYHLLFDLS